MYTKISLFSLVFGLFLVIPTGTIEASSVIRTGDAVSVENDQKIEGDFYSLSNILNISGEISGDMTSVGRKVTLNGSVTSDALLAGESVDVHGAVGDDLRVIGGDVIIAKPITGDVFVIAGSVTVLSTASIGGDLVLYAGDADVRGSVGGNILGRAESLRVDAPVAGLVDVKTGKLTVGDKADIAGSVQYESLLNLERSPNAKVAGDIVRNDPVEEDSKVSHKTFLVPLLMVLFSTLVWYLLAKTILVRITERALVRGIRPSATGFIFFFAAPVVTGILLLSVLGTMVGVAALVAYIFAILLALFSMGAVMGQLMMYVYKKRFSPITPLTLIVGVFGVCLLVLIPIIGPLVLIGLFIITLGAIVDLLLHPSR
ncbi:MAG: hypothetical protein KBC62_02050 [Candidatus Pacebacteria bacterium]|nr:hypothetical protein [Candidatus Paceibacterota bacterium]MBP9842765.1 hypothetical protein [Candidatus Paceibacterota bacterium]